VRLGVGADEKRLDVLGVRDHAAGLKELEFEALLEDALRNAGRAGRREGRRGREGETA
jgi:hypothetical protein